MLSNPNLDYTIQKFGGNGKPGWMMDPCLSSNSGANCGCPLRSSPFNTTTGFYQIEADLQSDGTPVRRALGGTCFGGMQLPTPNQVNQAVGISNFGPTYWTNGFSIEVEFNLHGTVHDWVGGSMMMLDWSASDPLFFMHHCFVDLLFERWLRRVNPAVPGPNVAPNSGAPVGHNLHDCLGPFFPLSDHKPYFRPSWNVGYLYDVLPAPPGVSSAPNSPHLQAMETEGRGDRSNVVGTVVGAVDSVGSVAQPVLGRRGERCGVNNVNMEPLRELHCFDFYQNFDEQDVDCGGVDCGPC